MEKTDKSVELLQLLRGGQGPGKSEGLGLRIVRVATVGPDTFAFEGSTLALDLDLFEVPKDFRPLEVGAKYFALPIVGGQRWGLIQRIN